MFDPVSVAMAVVGLIIALLVGLLIYAHQSDPGAPTSDSPSPSASSNPTSVPEPVTSSGTWQRSRTGGGPHAPSSSDDQSQEMLPLDDVRYGSYLESYGVTTIRDLVGLDQLTDVDRVGTEYGQIIRTDLRNAGVNEEVIPPVVRVD